MTEKSHLNGHTYDGFDRLSQITYPIGSTGTHTSESFTYDAENRIIMASGMTNGPYCYTYDGNGVRVMKAHASGGSCTGTATVDMLYWRNIAGNTKSRHRSRTASSLHGASATTWCSD